MAAFHTGGDEELVNLLYEAAGEVTLWREFLAGLLQRVNGRMAAFISHAPTSGKYPLVISVGADPEEERLYEAYYGAKDPWYVYGKQKLVEGWVDRGSSLCTPSDVVKTEFYNDFFRFYGHFYPLAAILEHQGDDRSFLTVLRDRSQPDFSNSDVRFLRQLFPHLRRALKLHRRMMDLRQAARTSANLLDALDTPLIGLDSDGKVLFMNRTSESILKSGEVLTLKNGKLLVRDPFENTALARLIRSACLPSSKDTTGDAITVHYADRSLHVAIFPYTASDDIFPSRPRALVTISDPAAAPRSRERLLTSLFRLTAAENRVTALLLSGLELKEIAARTHTKENTVRSHLKAIYGKTSVTRQSQLVRLVSTLPGL
jgi:DNA-binding CsgD family transcriptional regulator/PAS domain-containing protein